MFRSSNNENNFPHKLLLTNTQVSKILKAFSNGSATNTKFSKTQLSKIVQSGGFASNFLDLINPDKSLRFRPDKMFTKIVNEADKLSKKVTNNDIKKIAANSRNFMHNSKNTSDNVLGTGITLTNNEIKYIMKVIESLENRGILLKGTTRKITSQERRLLNFLRPLMTAGLPIMKTVLTPLTKSVFLSVGFAAGISAADVATENKIYTSGITGLMISKEETEDIMKIVESLEESGLLIKGISETNENKAKEQKGGFLPILLGTLAASILGNALIGRGVIRAGESTIRVGGNF